jgi:hypothetical protein
MLKIHDVSTGEIIERELTPEEMQDRATLAAEVAAEEEANAQKAIAKAALLDRLGITEEEAKLLLS